MVENKQIEKWLKEGTVTQEQANKMLKDNTEHEKDKSSNNFIITISTIGSVLLGVGAILFIASNWDKLPDLLKTFILAGSTFASYYVGYLFKYQKKNLPIVGSALLFLGGILFGATLFLLAQIYHIEANSHTIALLWLIGILPFVYAFISVEMAGLSLFVFYLWIGLFVLQDTGFSLFGFSDGSSETNNIYYLPILYLVMSLALFGIGGLHYFSDKFKKVARIYRLFGIQFSMLVLFLLSFRYYSGDYDGYSFRGDNLPSETFTITLTLLAIMAIITFIINVKYNPSKSRAPGIEYFTALILTVLALIFFNFPADNNIYVILFNLVLAGIIFLLLQQGYFRQDMAIVNTGIFFFVIFVLAKYFDFFWTLLDRSLFFVIGGAILLIGGIFLEGKRREIKARFTQHK